VIPTSHDIYFTSDNYFPSDFYFAASNTPHKNVNFYCRNTKNLKHKLEDSDVSTLTFT
jgi:hypothetical protein